MKLALRLAMIMSTIILPGCSNVALNTGATDYMSAPADKQSYVKKYQNLAEVDSSTISKGQSISVHLQHVFIKDFSERFERITSRFGREVIRGEIAVLARVFEMKDGTSISNSVQSMKEHGRLVYYSDDVRENGQPLNMSAVPIYGPITYNGNPLAIQIVILELDEAESDQIKGILSALVGLGQKAYPPASPVLQALDAVGSQLLNGERDDVEFSYTFFLYPSGGDKNLRYPYVRAGNYMFIKENPKLGDADNSQRYNITNWGKLKIDDATGRLVDNNSVLIRDNTYVSIQVISGFDPVGLDTAQSMLEFEAELNKAQSSAEFERKFAQAVKTFKRATLRDESRQDAREATVDVLSLIDDFEKVKANDIAEKQRIIASIYDMFVTRIKVAGTNVFSTGQTENIIRAMRVIAASPLNITDSLVKGTNSPSDLYTLMTK